MLMKDVDKLPHGPDWTMKRLKLTGNQGNQMVEFWKRNTLDSVKMLLFNKKLAQEMHWAPEKHWISRKKGKRRYGDMHKSKWWWRMQVCRPCILLRLGY